ncbi:hypothetical protein ONE63_000080 [Megalurothrips usitatus]|uniref:Reverse transcriptase domain-containing protein n=1 Tax=Megalurothrips usitatus TaxID=439358 RepID=A0AAV7Y182_9NEOP|nr:hypothetical protein ONE63_000080 [Megalurothrips usitatus]
MPGEVPRGCRDELNLLSSYLKSISNKYEGNLKITHINAQSLNDSTHFTEFKEIFCDSLFDIVAVSETFYKETNVTIDIPNYKAFRVDRTDRRGGGVAVYVAENLNAKILSKSDGVSFQPEYIALEVECQAERILVMCAYRPPKVGHMDSIVSELQLYLPKYKYAILIGDLNARFGSGSFETSNVEECLSLCNLTAIPFKATYHTKDCDSILDVIARNFNDLAVEHGQTAAPAFSNHDIIYAVFNIRVRKPVKKRVSYRDFSRIDVDALRRDADSISWQEVYEAQSIDSKVKVFNSKMIDLMDKHAPVRTKYVKRPSAPWFTCDILQMISDRNDARLRFLDTKDPNDLENFRVLRNKTKQVIKNAKTKYYHNVFDNIKTSKDLWSHINNLSSRNKEASVPNVPPNELNQHYLKVSTVSDDNLLHSTMLHYDNLPAKNGESFHFKYVTPLDIIKAINDVKSKAQGVDNISITFLKICIIEITTVLEHIFNFSLQSSVFPSDWKSANVIPIPKISNPTNCKDYRPISLLCVLSKVPEKLVHCQVCEYLLHNNILNEFQSGFRPGHSTTTALLKVAEDIRLAIDRRKLVLAALLDFSKAFDKVHHGLLLVKFKKNGFLKSVINWFHAYLSDRRQRVKAGGDYVSDWDFLDTGVPQGSILGPLLFLLYINDISDVLVHCKYHLYADDLQVYLDFDVDSVFTAVSLLNSDLCNILQFAASHNLSLNVEKTQPIVFGTDKLVNKLDVIPEIIIDGTIIPYKKFVNNLGVVFDANLSWTQQCNSMVKSVFRTLAIVRRNFSFLPIHIRKKIVECLLFPIFDYPSVLMTDLSVVNSNKLQVAQNACIRFIDHTPRHVHITPSYVKLNYLKLEQRRVVAISTLLWRIFKHQTPLYLLTIFTKTSAVKTRPYTRLSGDTLLIPHHRTSQYNRSFCVTSCRIWNFFKIYSYLLYSQPSTLKRSVVNNIQLFHLYS